MYARRLEGLGPRVFAIGFCIVISALPLSAQAKLNRNDVIVADSNGSSPGRIIRVDSGTGAQEKIADGGFLCDPQAVAIEANLNLLVADTCSGGSVIRINPFTGEQKVVSRGTGSSPTGIAIADDGTPFVSDFNNAVFKMDPLKGTREPVSAGSAFTQPTAIALKQDAQNLLVGIFVAGQTLQGGSVFQIDLNPDPTIPRVISLADFPGCVTGMTVDASGQLVISTYGCSAGPEVVRLNPAGGTTTVLSMGSLLVQPTGLAVESSGAIVVADKSSGGKLIRIDQTGAQTTLSAGGNLSEPRGVAIVQGNVLIKPGDIIVSDSQMSLPGKIILVDPVPTLPDGQQTLISSDGLLVDPVGIAIDGVGHLIVVDSAGYIVNINPLSGSQRRVLSADFTRNPYAARIRSNDLASEILTDDDLLTSENNSAEPGIILTDQSGVQRQLSTGGLFNNPTAMDFYGPDKIWVADQSANLYGLGLYGGVIELDLSCTTDNPPERCWDKDHPERPPGQTPITKPEFRGGPLGLAVERDGNALVTTTPGATIPSIRRIDGVTHADTELSRCGMLRIPTGIAVERRGSIIVTDQHSLGILPTPPNQCWDGFQPKDGSPCSTNDNGPGAVIRLDPKTGAQTMVSKKGMFCDPLGVVIAR